MNDTKLTEIEQTTMALTARMPSITAITQAGEAITVAEYMSEVREYRKRVEDFFRPDIDAAHSLHKSLLAKLKEVDAAPAKAEAQCRALLGDWTERERKRVADEQAELDAQARKRAAAEAKRDGDLRTAKAIESGRLAVVSDVIAEQSPRIEGLSSREVWSANVVDLMALVKAVAAGKAMLDYLAPDMTRLNSVMRATRGQQAIPGVVAVKAVSVAQRR